jgi:hypothetical protein
MHLEHDFGKDGAYHASPPMHTIRTEIKATWPLIVKDIALAVNTAVGNDIASGLQWDFYV